MTKNDCLVEQLNANLAHYIREVSVAYGEVTIECDAHNLIKLMHELRDADAFQFNELIDLCAVDYLNYGQYDWKTNTATENGFSRGVEAQEVKTPVTEKRRFAVVYHLLSTVKNHRLRVKLFIDVDCLIVPSIHELWKGANWFEREAYDLYGVLFNGHPDLRRLLTDYGFIGHPFRKDFPLSGQVEMRYDAKLEKVIYAPVEIIPRILVPKVIRNDSRYIAEEVSE